VFLPRAMRERSTEHPATSAIRGLNGISAIRSAQPDCAPPFIARSTPLSFPFFSSTLRVATIAADSAPRQYPAIATVGPSNQSGALRIIPWAVIPCSPGGIGNSVPTNWSLSWKIRTGPLRTVDGFPNLTLVFGKPLDNFALTRAPFCAGCWVGENTG
jgi:hypothetical protein